MRKQEIKKETKFFLLLLLQMLKADKADLQWMLSPTILRLLLSYFISCMSLSGHGLPWKSLKSGKIQIKIIIFFFAIEIKILKVCSTLWECVLANY